MELRPGQDGDVGLVSAPLIDHQIATLMLRDFLNPLRTTVLSRLRQLLVSEKGKYWLDIFLATFVVLDSLGRLMNQQRSLAKRQKLEFVSSIRT